MNKKNIALLLFLAGFLSLALENLGLQVLFLYHPQASEAMALGLSIFLFGLAAANFITHYFNNLLLKNKTLILFFILFLIALFAGPILSPIERNYVFINSIFKQISLHLAINLPWHWFTFILLSFIYLFLPALAVGILFPLIADHNLQETEKIKRTVGWMNSIDFLGAIISSLLVGFYFVPQIGLAHSFWWIGIISSISMLILSLKLKKTLKIISLTFTIILIALKPTNYINPTHYTKTKVLFQQNSSYGLVRVLVEEKTNKKILMINNRDMCISPGSESEKDLARLTLKNITSDDTDVLNIGLGCGITASQILDINSKLNLDLVEINRVVYEATSIHFKSENKNVLENPRTHFYLEDGLQFLQKTNKNYSRIIIDIEEPTIMHSSIFYTKEGFEIVKNRLNSNGVFALWSMKQNETAKIILNTLRSVFKNATVIYSNGFLIFLASNRGLSQDLMHSPYLNTIEKIKINTIATIENNPYAKYYNIYDLFNIDEKEKDPFVIK